MEEQGTVGFEIFNDSNFKIDYLVFSIGGGGLASAISTVFKQLSPKTKLVAVEPLGSPTMGNSIGTRPSCDARKNRHICEWSGRRTCRRFNISSL